MKRPSTLSATFVKTVKRPGRYGDGRGGHGLTLLVKPTKINNRLSKTWAQRIRINGKETNLGLGSYPAVTLAEARKRALQNRQAIEEGRNPRAAATPTFTEATAKVIELHSTKWRPGSRSRRIWETSLQTYTHPTLGEKLVSDITSADVMACFAPIWHTKPETARRLLQRVAAIMKWAIAAGHRTDNPADDRIRAALGTNNTQRQHFKALHHSKVSQALATIRATNAWPATIYCLEFLTLCAVRSGEARLATWNEIDLPTATWTIPGQRTKTGKPHRVPLSTTALQILDQAHRQLPNPTGLIFPSPTGRPLSDATMSKLCKENNIGCVPHGMRSSFRDWCSETRIPREIAEQALGHTVKGVEAAYARSDLLKIRQPLMQQWAEYIKPTKTPDLG